MSGFIKLHLQWKTGCSTRRWKIAAMRNWPV